MFTSKEHLKEYISSYLNFCIIHPFCQSRNLIALNAYLCDNDDKYELFFTRPYSSTPNICFKIDNVVDFINNNMSYSNLTLFIKTKATFKPLTPVEVVSKLNQYLFKDDDSCQYILHAVLCDSVTLYTVHDGGKISINYHELTSYYTLDSNGSRVYFRKPV